MLNIKVLGPGCAKCYALERVAANALEAMLKENPDLEATLQHIEDQFTKHKPNNTKTHQSQHTLKHLWKNPHQTIHSTCLMPR